MPRDLVEVGALAKSPAFLARVTAAMARIASHVGRQDSSTAEHHVLRREYAREFARWTDDVVQGMAWLVAAQPDVAADLDDCALVVWVNELWNAAAGAGSSVEWKSPFDEVSAP